MPFTTAHIASQKPARAADVAITLSTSAKMICVAQGACDGFSGPVCVRSVTMRDDTKAKTWKERIVELLEQNGPMTVAQMSVRTNLPWKRASSLLSRAWAYGWIDRPRAFRWHHNPEYRVQAVYAAKSNDNGRRR